MGFHGARPSIQWCGRNRRITLQHRAAVGYRWQGILVIEGQTATLPLFNITDFLQCLVMAPARDCHPATQVVLQHGYL